MTEAFLETMIAGVAAAAAAAASRLAEAGLPVEIARFDVDAGVEATGDLPRLEAAVTIQLAPQARAVRIARGAQAP